jgi:hypothetical protein
MEKCEENSADKRPCARPIRHAPSAGHRSQAQLVSGKAKRVEAERRRGNVRRSEEIRPESESVGELLATRLYPSRHDVLGLNNDGQGAILPRGFHSS